MNESQRVEEGANLEEKITGSTRRSGGGLIKLLIVASVVLAFCGALVYAYNKGQRQNTAYVPPNITAPPGPIRTRPKDPGGMEVPGISMEVLNSEADTLLPPKTAGAKKEVAVRKIPEERPDPPAATEKPQTEKPQTEKPQKESAEEKSSQSPVQSEPPSAPSLESVAAVRPAKKPPVPTASKQRSKAASTRKTQSASRPKPQVATVSPAPSVAYYVQLFSFRSEAAVRNGWAELKSRHRDLLGRMAMNIDRRTIQDKGVYYRLRVGPFNAKPEAQRLCDKLKARKQGCFVVRS